MSGLNEMDLTLGQKVLDLGEVMPNCKGARSVKVML